MEQARNKAHKLAEFEAIFESDAQAVEKHVAINPERLQAVDMIDCGALLLKRLLKNEWKELVHEDVGPILIKVNCSASVASPRIQYCCPLERHHHLATSMLAGGAGGCNADHPQLHGDLVGGKPVIWDIFVCAHEGSIFTCRYEPLHTCTTLAAITLMYQPWRKRSAPSSYSLIRKHQCYKSF
eukprot:SAG31_NODE_1007_length_10425_cov_4.852799_11_plen_183_part_00